MQVGSYITRVLIHASSLQSACRMPNSHPPSLFFDQTNSHQMSLTSYLLSCLKVPFPLTNILSKNCLPACISIVDDIEVKQLFGGLVTEVTKSLVLLVLVVFKINQLFFLFIWLSLRRDVDGCSVFESTFNPFINFSFYKNYHSFWMPV